MGVMGRPTAPPSPSGPQPQGNGHQLISGDGAAPARDGGEGRGGDNQGQRTPRAGRWVIATSGCHFCKCAPT